MNLWERVEATDLPSGDNWLDKMRDDSFDADRDGNKLLDNFKTERRKRNNFIAEFGWAVPTREIIQKIADFVGEQAIVEVFAGKGLWAKLLSLQGVMITPTDQDPKFISPLLEEKIGTLEAIPHMHILKMKATTAIKSFNPKVLMMVWPPYEKEVSYEALRLFTGDKFIYVGEGDGGCTGDDDFHEHLNDHWEERECISIPQWDHIHDRLYLYTRKVKGY